MSEKDADDNSKSEPGSKSDAAQALAEEDASLDSLLDGNSKKKENEAVDLDSYLPSHESPLKKEENPFSFKKFLNQDSSAQKNKGARKKVYTPPNVGTSSKIDMSNHSLNKGPGDLNARIVSATDMSSVLPDFVQDHLVIEQCYLSGSSPAIDIDNLNLQNLPDLNLEHRNVHFIDRNTNHSSQSSCNQFSTNLPDFTLGVRNFQSGTHSNSKVLPDFTLSTRPDTNDGILFNFKDRTSRRKGDTNNTHDTSQSTRQRVQISSSPSVPLDLPSYESIESNQNLPIPFDLTVPAEEKNSSSRGMTSTETVSKSLPDFLSDGPIKKEMDESLQNVRGNISSAQNGLPPPEISSARPDYDRLHREIELLRCQLSEKCRRVEMLETELEHLHSRDQRETASLEYALKDVEKNLKQTAKRALNAEDMVLKLKQENKLLKSEINSLRSENVELKIGNLDSKESPSQNAKYQKLAKELRTAANGAEASLRTLLMGVDNLRALADSVENSVKIQDDSKDYSNFSYEDSAAGPPL